MLGGGSLAINQFSWPPFPPGPNPLDSSENIPSEAKACSREVQDCYLAFCHSLVDPEFHHLVALAAKVVFGLRIPSESFLVCEFDAQQRISSN